MLNIKCVNMLMKERGSYCHTLPYLSLVYISNGDPSLIHYYISYIYFISQLADLASMGFGLLHAFSYLDLLRHSGSIALTINPVLRDYWVSESALVYRQ